MTSGFLKGSLCELHKPVAIGRTKEPGTEPWLVAMLFTTREAKPAITERDCEGLVDAARSVTAQKGQSERRQALCGSRFRRREPAAVLCVIENLSKTARSELR